MVYGIPSTNVDFVTVFHFLICLCLVGATAAIAVSVRRIWLYWLIKYEIRCTELRVPLEIRTLKLQVQ